MATKRPKPNKPGATKRKRPTKIDAVLKLLKIAALVRIGMRRIKVATASAVPHPDENTRTKSPPRSLV